MFLGLDKLTFLCYAITVKKNAKKIQVQYRFIATVWYDRHDDQPNQVYQAQTVTTLDWSSIDIQNALVCGLLEEVTDE